MQDFSLAIHGGAGTILKSKMTAAQEAAYLQALEGALQAGRSLLEQGKSAEEAVTAAVCALEDADLFNAGRGSVFTHEGGHEMEASIMRGADLQAGGVAGISSVKNPILLAAEIMQDPDWVFLSGAGAEDYARERKLAFESPEYFYSQYRYEQWQGMKESTGAILDHSDDRKFGTVGAVALDKQGNLAAATSTGGLTNKRYGRLGDSAVIGSGTYANNATCAISCTGYGEYFLRAVVAYDVSCLMEYKGLSLKDACHVVVQQKLKTMGGEGGLIAVDSKGAIELAFNCEGMYRGWTTRQSPTLHTAIYK